MGTDAAGYPHLFLGTGRPVDLWIARLSARATWGVVDASPYAVNPGAEGRRFLPAIVLAVSPRGLDGLELGLGRLYHVAWPEGGPGLDEFLRPFEAFLKRSRGEIGGADGFSTPDNQLAAVFARWAFPSSGFEVWAEYGRNDHNWDLRDLALQPDHDMVLGGGFRKVWKGEDAWWALSGEAVNGQITHLAKVRQQVHFYRHRPGSRGTRTGVSCSARPPSSGVSALTWPRTATTVMAAPRSHGSVWCVAMPGCRPTSSTIPSPHGRRAWTCSMSWIWRRCGSSGPGRSRAGWGSSTTWNATSGATPST
jgi:hypothetical protein